MFQMVTDDLKSGFDVPLCEFPSAVRPPELVTMKSLQFLETSKAPFP